MTAAVESPLSQLPADAQARVIGRAAGAGEYGRNIRLAAGLTQHEIGRIVGVTQGCIARWEASTRIPRGASAERYGELLRALVGGAA